MNENQYKDFDTVGSGPEAAKKSWFSLQRVDKYLRFAIFLVVVGLIYIWNAHTAEKQVRRRDTLNHEIRELKSKYTTLNSELSYGTRQSEIADRVDTLGLTILTDPPFDLTEE